jgi:hypothetical protein
MNLAVVFPLVVVIICAATLVGCYVAFDRLQTRIEQTRGGGGRRGARVGAPPPRGGGVNF